MLALIFIKQNTLIQARSNTLWISLRRFIARSNSGVIFSCTRYLGCTI